MADRRLLRRAGALALLIAVALCVAGTFQHGLWTPDEPREAEVGREMLDSGFSAMPTLGGEPFLEKPPLYAWITAASYAVCGVSAGAARIPSMLFSIGAIWIAYLLGKRAAGRLELRHEGFHPFAGGEARGKSRPGRAWPKRPGEPGRPRR